MSEHSELGGDPVGDLKGIDRLDERDQSSDLEYSIVDSFEKETLAHFTEHFRSDITGTAVPIIALIVLGGLMSSSGAFALAALVSVCLGIRQLGRLPLANGNLPGTIALIACGNWAVTTGVVIMVPAGAAVVILNLVVPLVMSATFLSDRQHHIMMALGLAVSLLVGTIAFTHDSFGLVSNAEIWQVQIVSITFLAGHTWGIGRTFRTAIHLRERTLELVLDSNTELRKTEQELRRSRHRLVTVADDERFRIERNIHDGAQQRLISLAVQLRLASQLTAAGKPTPVETLVAMEEEARSALQELRELASGIFPSVLADRGLVEALIIAGRRSPLVLRMDGPDDLDLPAEVEVAVYFVCMEALQNATKHGGANVTVEVRIRIDEDDLVLRITDDGAGFDQSAITETHGILSMIDRIAAIGGELAVKSTLGRGTTVAARIPIEASLQES